MDAQTTHQTQILEAQKSINAQQLNGPMIIGSTQQPTSGKGPVTVAAPLGFEPVVNTDMNKITLGKNSVADKFESDIDVPPEDLYDDEFLNDLDHRHEQRDHDTADDHEQCLHKMRFVFSERDSYEEHDYERYIAHKAVHSQNVSALHSDLFCLDGYHRILGCAVPPSA